ncbi:Helix-turn-helix domain protein [Paraliobacillus sp. PM-2]|uniref:excisionase family DNA-binding protein n=1 Tax=Paraliobacillus sp. PM-2 TaxID=1462524 RepID=UPI00061CB777|nr:excisionase family DNA-binding protein [Paraliobacillus sp. PM-2]CQR47974.1 Helix-turn-helix domain protein [Paraliobacillus sp. PM-2]
MYLTINETADYLDITEKEVRQLIFQKRIRFIHDGDNYLINQDQFQEHFKQVERYKQQIQDYLNEPIPEDMDVKDED